MMCLLALVNYRRAGGNSLFAGGVKKKAGCSYEWLLQDGDLVVSSVFPD